MKIDLHSHTTASDGRAAPAELVRLARGQGIDVLAVTDHDTTEGLAEAAAEAPRVGLRLVPGIELSARFARREVHVLGIGIDPSDAPLQEKLARMRQVRRERVEKICAALGGLGVTLEPAAVLAEAMGKSVGRKHVARAMVKAGLVRNDQEAFDRYLEDGGPAHVPSSDLSPGEAAALLRAAGGFPVLAHPHFLDGDEQVEAILDESGIKGIEAHHRYERPGRALDFLALAARRGLLVTGGSDYHGDDNPRNGTFGEHLTPPDQWAEIERRLAALRPSR